MCGRVALAYEVYGAFSLSGPSHLASGIDYGSCMNPLALVPNLPMGVVRWGARSTMKGCNAAFAVRHGVFEAMLASNAAMKEVMTSSSRARGPSRLHIARTSAWRPESRTVVPAVISTNRGTGSRHRRFLCAWRRLDISADSQTLLRNVAAA